MTSHAMTAHAVTAQARADADQPRPRAQVWDQSRLSELRAEVGEDGFRAILHLFEADLAFYRKQLEVAAEAGNEATARHLLAGIEDAARGLGLAALATLAKDLGEAPLDPANPARLEREAALIRRVPDPQRPN